MFLRTGFLFVGSPFFIDFESKLSLVNHRGMALSFNADFFHRPEFDLCPCVSIYAHAFSLFFGAFGRFPFSGHSHKITNFFQQTEPTLPSFGIITLEL